MPYTAGPSSSPVTRKLSRPEAPRPTPRRSIWAAAAATVVGYAATSLPPSLEWLELSLSAPLILLSYGAIIWFKGFTSEDRVLFRRRQGDALPLNAESAASR